MARRAAALLAMFVIVLLAATLFYRVYRHHEDAERYSDEPAVVYLDGKRPAAVKFAHLSR